MRERAIVLSRKRGASERNDFCDANNRRRNKSKHSARNAECCGVCLAAVVVETTRLELVTSCMSSKRSNQLG